MPVLSPPLAAFGGSLSTFEPMASRPEPIHFLPTIGRSG